MNMNGKIYAITGEIGSGKSSVLYAFGKMGARFLSQDHLAFKYFPDDLYEDYEIIQVIQEHIDTYRKADPPAPLFIEIHLWVLEKIQSQFDGIIVVCTNRKNRQQRLALRGGYDIENTYYLTEPYGIKIKADRIFINNKDKLNLWLKIEKFYKKLVPKNMIRQINWREAMK